MLLPRTRISQFLPLLAVILWFRQNILLQPLMRLVLTALLFISLASCSSVREATLKAGPNDGKVILSLSSNVGGHIPLFTSVTLARADGSRTTMYSLENTEPGRSIERDTKLFVGAVPAGSYFIESFEGYNARLYVSQTLVDAGGFRVEAGRTSDLGRVIITDSGQVGKIKVRRSPISSNRWLASDLPSAWHGVLDTPLPSPWLQAATQGIDPFKNEQPQGFVGFSSDGESIYSGARLGAVVKRSQDGHWQVLGRSESLLSVLSTTVDGDGTVVAAGEFGALFRVNQTGQVRELDRGNLPAGDIVFIDHSPDFTQWLVAIQDGKHLSVLLASTVEGGSWKELWSEPYEWVFWEQLAPLVAWSNSKGVAVVSTVSSSVGCYEWANKSWHVSPSPNGVIQKVARGTGDIFGIGTTGSFYGEKYISSSCGQSWSKIESPHSARATEGVPFKVGDQYVWTEGSFSGSATATFISSDAGKTWKQTSGYSVEPGNVWFFPQKGLMFAVSTEKEYVQLPYGGPGHEKILLSKDGGLSWQEDFK